MWNFESLSDEHDTLTTDFNSLDHTYDTLSSNYEALLNQYQKAVASLPLSPEPISAETINMNYEWTFKGREWNLSLLVPESQYDYYQEKERTSTRDYSVYVTHPFDDEFINTIIMKFNFIALEMEYTEEEKINLVISFVQSLPYTSDNVTTPYDEYPRYPLETLVDNGGDCEDTSILTCALLKSMNYDVILIAPPRHMAVGVNIDTDGWSYTKNNKQYFYLETTSEGWEIGSIPDEYKQVGAYRYELKPTPIITHNWTASWKGSTLEVVISVQNEGTAIASGIWVKTGFDAGESKWWKREESDPFDLNWGKSYTITLLLDPPPENKHTRLIILVKDIGGNTLNRRYSNWFDT